MSFSICNNYTLVFTIFLIIQNSECRIVRRYNYDARLHEHFSLTSRHIQFSRTESDEWKNITAMAEARNFTFTSMICTMGPGAWIFYPDPEYEMGNSLLYYLVVGEHCVRADDIESVQPLGKQDELLEQGIILFEKPQFASPQIVVTEGEGSGGSGSLIFTGGASYLIEGGGQRICLRPGLTVFEDGYCLIPNLKSAFNIEGGVNVKDGCSEDPDDTEEKKLVVQACYLEGVHEIYSDQDLAIDTLNEVCNGGGDNFQKNKFTILMDMWSKRMGDDLGTTPEFIKPENEIKLGILWSMIEIFKEGCTNVDEIYVYLLGHLFSMHLKHLWNNNPDYNGTKSTAEQWKVASENLQFCLEHLEDVPIYSGSCRGDDDFNRQPGESGSEESNGFTETDSSWYTIVNGEMFDPVIEQVWLMINFVLPSCNLAAGYINNDWNDLVVLFHQNFLDPLQDIWADPRDWRRIYNAVFHGYDMRGVQKDFVACLKGALESSPDYDPIGRPKSFRQYMTYKYQTPDPGQIVKPGPERRKRGGKKN